MQQLTVQLIAVVHSNVVSELLYTFYIVNITNIRTKGLINVICHITLNTRCIHNYTTQMYSITVAL